MNSQKRENLLNLSLDATKTEREKSQILEVGFDPDTKRWEVIAKYHGDIGRISDDVIKVEELLNGYAIITLPEELMDALSDLEEIEYIEKPKSLIYNIYQAKTASCILPVTIGTQGLTGKGTLVAVIDSGIDYFLPDFQNEEGSRILYLWDQTMTADDEKGFFSPPGFAMGVEYTKEQIDAALATGNRAEALKLVPETDLSGHGTAVAGIAAGSSDDPLHRGIAPESELIIIKLGPVQEGGFPRTTELMRAVSYVLTKAIELKKPIAVNMSFGNSYGAHDGTSLLERFIDNACEVNRNVICVGSGNEGASGGHVSGRIERVTSVELAIDDYEQSISVQLWKNYADNFEVEVVAPDGQQFRVVQNRPGRQTWNVQDTTVLIYMGMPNPYSVNQEIFFDFISRNQYVMTGIWTFVLTPIRIVKGLYQMYLPGDAVRSSGTRFLRPSPDLTLTIPSTASKVITVGAYNALYQAYADFSGRGEELAENGILANPYLKPDIVAPGVGVTAPIRGGGYEPFTGTSFATPIVTGSAALLMEWGIVQGNDPYLYGEKIKAYLIRGARHLPGYEIFPNPQVGWGALCLQDSMPE